ncbi:MAG: hypothetical protein CMM18_03820 [Rhodospirillaceae bacterium]|nr:hypothetical protein [Rhodospirillaceae bacterium]|tara:strand:- start:176 stop:835 length:660 start_codon:yes stop_codon:yes gene_type:complete
MSQYNFEFKNIPAFERKDFIVSSSNFEAVSWLDKWPNWEKSGIFFYGAPGSGKTHLIHSWKFKTGGLILNEKNSSNFSINKIYENKHLAVDNASKIPEKTLLHVINICIEEKGTIFILDREAPARWEVSLKDLESRLRAMTTVELKNPDDKLIEQLFFKLFYDRQIKINDDVVKYLVKRVERDFEYIQSIVEIIDTKSFSYKKEITIPFVAGVLKKINF